MRTKKTIGKAVIIDDTYARPTSTDFRSSLTALRAFLTENSKTKNWFDKEFELSGDHTRRNYFEPLMSDPQKLQKLWAKRNKSPAKEELPKTVFAEIEAELGPYYAPLLEIERIFEKRGWELQRFSSLPSVEEVPEDTSVVVIDYLLSNETPEDISREVEKSTKFLREMIERSQNNAASRYPFIVLISSLPSLNEKLAFQFRKTAKTPGGFFRFVKKTHITNDFTSAINTFATQELELHCFRHVHESLQQAIESATKKVKDYIDQMELEDLATLHAGQLATEKEPLSDYLGWLSGQVVSALVQKDVNLARKTEALPNGSHQLLLGHIRPTQSISQVFTSFSVIKTASGELHKKNRSIRQVRFGDLFAIATEKIVGKATPNAAGKPVGNADVGKLTYFLVISQTCDLQHGKIPNGQVLCIQGTGSEVKENEADLLRATIRQMDGKGNIFEKEKGQYVQIEWDSKSLITIPQAILSKEQKGYQYLGRLNEIYALEAQQTALHGIGRIGVPIIPGYRMFFSKVLFRVFGGKSEIAELASNLDKNTILGLLRNEKSGTTSKQRLIFSEELRLWMIKHISSIMTNVKVPEQLKKPLEEMNGWLSEKSHDFCLIVKFKDGIVSGFQREEIPKPEETVKGENKTITKPLPGTIDIVLNSLVSVDQTKSNARIQIEFVSAV